MEVLGSETLELGVGALGCLLVGIYGLLEVLVLCLGRCEILLEFGVLLLKGVEGIAGVLEFEFEVV